MKAWALVLLTGCAAAAPAEKPSSEAKVIDDDETRIAESDLRLRVDQFGASAVVPQGWQYLRFEQAVLTQSPTRGAGLILFGASDLNEMQTTLIKLGSALNMITGEQLGDESELQIGGAKFVIVAYPRSRIAARGADVRIGVAHLQGAALLTFVSYGMDGEKDEVERLKRATESILIE